MAYLWIMKRWTHNIWIRLRNLFNTDGWDKCDNRYFWDVLRRLRNLGYYEQDLYHEDVADISSAHFRRMKNGDSPTSPKMKKKLEAGLKKLEAKRKSPNSP